MVHSDFIVVGAGSAGAVLASRLSSRESNRVLLLEAGADTPPDQEPPEILDNYPIIAYFNPRYHWTDLRVHLRPDGSRGGGRAVRYEQARIMGGGSSINGMFAMRGLPWDYDGWAAMGAQGWAYADVLPFLLRLERDLDYAGELHGRDGRLLIRRLFPEVWPGFARAVAAAMEQEGFRYLPDHNADWSDGYFPMAISNAYGHRVSTAMGYLDPVTRQRPNLTIRTHALVTRLLVEGRRVVGVEAEVQGRRTEFRAREVIVSAGALHSPALLLRAGIGPADELRALGLPVVADLPGVGGNLQDHPMVAIAAHLRPAARIPRGMGRHIHFGLRYSSRSPGCPAGDMFVLPSNRAAWHPLGRQLGSILVCVNKPYSTGRVYLQSADPRREPAVDFNLLSDQRDLHRLMDGMKLLHRLARSPQVAACNDALFPATFSERVRALALVNWRNRAKTTAAARLLESGRWMRRFMVERVISPGAPLDRVMADDAALQDWIERHACGSWHAAGTCRMGAAGDPRAVVDPAGRVYQVDGLRVADASIMPAVIAANTMITTVMIAEKIAASILAE